MRHRVCIGLALCLAGCASGGSTTERSGVRSVSAATSTGANAPGDAEARIARLKRSFECTDVPSASAFVCSVKDGIVGSRVRKRIEPVVTSSGTIFLRSVYRDRDWIYHDHVVVRIGEREWQTASLPAESPDVLRRESRRDSGRNSRDNERYIAETLSYRGGSDNGIVRAIAQAGDATVSMRLSGGPRLYEKVLSNDEKQLFSDAYELAALLRTRAEGRR
jgi:hypothetical protein